jgi:hypothetical protein
LINFFLERNENFKEKNRKGETAIELTTDQKIKERLLSQFTFAERLKMANYTGKIPPHMLGFTGEVMTEPTTCEILVRKLHSVNVN